ncbi:MAG: mannose-6-phosphate isomerase, class I [Spirochaetales bacterium]|jgi:mannose-6-phosphate isomerase|nr:mannose-6-phosphate isomerase, class I [Spirochaetales bacterium]
MFYRLKNEVQRYAWGSVSLLPDFLGMANPDKTPWAELWMGSHPACSSRALSGGGEVPLNELIDSDPPAFLGEAAMRRFDARLPFLFKVLAAGSPLSIQCHPSLERARAGFERENSLGIPLDSPLRNYKDSNHKPEMLLAVTDFTALRGLRPLGEITGFFSLFPVPELNALAEALAKDETEAGLKTFLRSLLASSPSAAREWIHRVKDFCTLEGGAGAASGEALPAPEAESFLRIADFFPEDAGAFAPFYLNLVRLLPGEAVFLGAGEMHAYLEGLGVELMANSDNVLRGGLTPKHIDAEELLSVLDYSPRKPEIIRPCVRRLSGGFTEEEYPSAAREFFLSVVRGPAAHSEKSGGSCCLECGGPEILLSGEGRASLLAREGGEPLVLEKGESVFIPAKQGAYFVRGECVLYRARVPA